MKIVRIIPLLVLTFVMACSPANRSNRIKKKFKLANKKLEEGYYKESIALFSQVIEGDQELTDAYLNRGVAYYHAGNYALSLADYNEVYRQLPEYNDILFNRAYAYIELGRFESAMEDLDQLSKLYPDTALVELARGLAFEKNQAYDEAIVSFTAAISKDAAYFDAYSNRGITYYHLKNFQKAEADFFSALSIHENEPYTLNALALNFADQGMLRKADSCLSIANNLVGSHPYFINNSGYVQYLMGAYQAADSLVRLSLTLDVKNPWAFKNLGMIQMKQNDEGADFNLKKSLSLFISNDNNTEACLVYQLLTDKTSVENPCL